MAMSSLLNDDKSCNKLLNIPSKTTENYDEQWLKGTSAENLLVKPKTEFSDPVYKKLSRINGKINSMSMSELVESLNELKLETNGKKEVLIRRLKNYHKQSNLENNKNNPNFKTEKYFDYVCVIDFEATCSEAISQYPEDSFQCYCKPVINPKLSNFCTGLTGITQDKVENAKEFPDVLDSVNDWLLKHELGTKYKFAVATDGPWDCSKFLALQCSHNRLPYPTWAKKWIDVRKLFSNWFGVRRCGITKMLAYIGLEFEGNKHCGLDDSTNIARILIKLMGDGCKLKINDQIKTAISTDKAGSRVRTNSVPSNSDAEN